MYEKNYAAGLSLVLLATIFGCGKTYNVAPLSVPIATPISTPTPLPEVYLALGDSVSYGIDATGVSLCFVNLLFQNNAAVYPTDVGMDLSTKYPGIQLLNLAIPGATSMTVINNEMSSIPQGAASPTFVTILIGGNELITTCGNSPGVGSPCDGGIFGCTTAQGATWASNFQARLETQIVDVLKNTALYPRVQKIVIANIYDPTDGVGLAAYGWPAGEAVLAQYNTAIQNVVNDTGSTLVDDYTLFLGHGIQYNIISNPYYDSANPTFWYTPNGASLPIHPNNTGYFELYKLFWPDF